MYCNKCGNEIKRGEKFCTKCGAEVKNKTLIIKRKPIIILLVIILLIICLIYYAYNNNSQKQREKLLNEIQDVSKTELTMEDLANTYECSVEDLTVKKLREILKDYKEYRKEQDEYASKYNEKLIEAKETCINMINQDVLNIPFEGVSNGYNISIYPQTMDSINFMFILIDPNSEELLRIGTVLIYTGNGTVISNGNKEQLMSSFLMVGAELDLTTNEIEYIWKGGELNDDSRYAINEGDNINWGERYGQYPYALTTSTSQENEFLFMNMDKEPIGKIQADEQTETNDPAEDTELTGIEQAIEDGVLDANYMTKGITQKEIYNEFYNGKLKNYYSRWEACLTDANKLGILLTTDDNTEVDTSNITKDTDLTGIEQAIKDCMLDADYMRIGITEDEIYYEYYYGNLDEYYVSFNECVKDAEELGILINNDE